MPATWSRTCCSRASQRLGEYLRNPVLPFHLWLRQIARDHVIDAHRQAPRGRQAEPGPRAVRWSSARVRVRSPTDPRSTWPRSSATPRSRPRPRRSASELQRRFQAALDELDGDDREIILLRHFEQLSNSEAAQVLGLSEAAAGMRHLRALRRLRAILGEAPSLC